MSLCFYFCVPWCLKIKCVNVCGCQMSLLMINAKILRFPLVLCILMKQTGWNGPVHNENAHLTVSDYYQRRVSTMCPPQCVSGSSW